MKQKAAMKRVTIFTNQNSVLSTPKASPQGGTWIGCQSLGTVLCLLNRYDTAPNPESMSRGLIIPELLKLHHHHQRHQYLIDLNHTDFNPFNLLTIETQELLPETVYLYTWNGSTFFYQEFEINSGMLLTSSSVETVETIAARQHYFQHWKQSNAFKTSTTFSQSVLSAIHLQHNASSLMNKSRSIFMDRSHSHSKSITQLTINQQGIKIRYSPLEQLPDLFQQKRFTHNNHTQLYMPLPRTQPYQKLLLLI